MINPVILHFRGVGCQLPDSIQDSITVKNLKDSILLWPTGYFPYSVL